MAFDGITISNIVKDLNRDLIGGRIYKIAQPENDELLLTIKNNGGQKRLFISADASLPLLYLTEYNKVSPMTAPNFCMLLRKHLQNAKILSITQPDFERIVKIEMEHLDELGDLCRKFIIVELMGKHSNIIFCNEAGMIIDSIKHISGMVSSLREVLPGRPYFVPKVQDKHNPLNINEEIFNHVLNQSPTAVFKSIYLGFTGISPVVANEICYRSNIDGGLLVSELSINQRETLYQNFYSYMDKVKNGEFLPVIVYEAEQPIEYCALPLTCYPKETTVYYDEISNLLEHYYREKNTITRIRQKSVDLRKVVQTALERNIKKYDLQIKQMEDTDKKDKYKVYGELLNAYGYGVEPGAESMEALNYYTNESVRIPLDPQLTTVENAKKYFDRYGKLKRTYEALFLLTKEVKTEIEHLESISNALDIALMENDLVQIKEELILSGYIRRKGGQKKEKITSKPFHYVSSDGFHIYIGKNNFQNDELTFQFATGNDWWFHAKNIPGSHVIVKSNGEQLPDKTFEEAARLAAHYSKGKGQDKVEIDYTEKKNVKKPSGGKPGFVIYYTNYSMMIGTDIGNIVQVDV